jgi:predicted O-methyltransferase YrrM
MGLTASRAMDKAYEVVVSRLPGTLAGKLDHLRPSLRDSWGGPLNGQARRQDMFRELISALDIAAIVETGTYRGTTTEFFAHLTGVPVYTMERVRRYFEYARRRLACYPHVHPVLGDSREYLHRLAARRDHKGDLMLFYLDAHWDDDLPLRQEIELIVRSWESAIIVVDDFEVPGDEGYQYDDYGTGKALTAEYLRGDALNGYSIFYPAASSTAETGAMRGCVGLVAPQLVERVSALEHLQRAESVAARTYPPGAA